MTSNINPSSNGYSQLFPVAGVVNSTQGFRNNFSSLYGNLLIAKDEITNLHNKAIHLTGDVFGTTTPVLVVDGNESAPVAITLQLRDDVTFPGTGGVVVPNGTTASRPSSPALGTIRYNVTTGRMEFYTGAWTEIGGTGGSYVSTAGDIVKGDIIMSGQGNVAQLLADPQYDASYPGIAFSSDEDTGIARSADGEMTFLSNGSPSMVVGETVSFPTGISSKKRTYGHSVEEYFYLNDRTPGTWETVLTWEVGFLLMTRYASINLEFLYAGQDPSGSRGFAVSGTCRASMIYQRITPTDDTLPSVITGVPAVELQTSWLNAIASDVEFRIIYDSQTVLLQCRGTNGFGGGITSNWDLTGKASIHYSQWGDLPMTATYD